MTWKIAAFYKFFPLPDYKNRQNSLKRFMAARDICGTILLSSEGINGTIAGSEEATDELIAYLCKYPGFAELDVKYSYTEDKPFARIKVKLKNELISLGVPVDPNKQVGTYVKPEDWNALISDPDVILVDARNDYEYYIGHFHGAEDPHTRKFRQITEYTEERLDPARHKKIATYCTGGIRCEKYTSYLKEKGFEEVYHLEGGILAYLEHIPEKDSMWEGSCYVFDDRIAVRHGLEVDEETGACPGCGHPLYTKDRNHPDYILGKQCGYCATAIPSNADKRPSADRYSQQ